MNEHSGSAQSAQRLAVAEFDEHARLYEELLADPLRDFFSGRQSHFFHLRKRDLLLSYLREQRLNPKGLTYLDVGCGKGELLRLLSGHFMRCAGCDPSSEMISGLPEIETRLQNQYETLPFESSSFDVITAVNVYHHVAPSTRLLLTKEIRRVLKPKGVCAVIEHNPYNLVTRRIVNRCRFDTNAVLLKCREVKELFYAANIEVDARKYFLYFPESIYRAVASCEEWLGTVPLGGQYVVFGRTREANPEREIQGRLG